MEERTYIAIDLKSFYASVEAADLGLDPLKTNLVVADSSRTEKTICLAVSPSLKAFGISGRARLFEVVQRVKEVNRARYARAKALNLLVRGVDGKLHFTGSSVNEDELAADPSLKLDYIVATPRMRLYEEVSTRIFSVYLEYISEEDIHVYSIDECFMDVTPYRSIYGLSPHELALKMIREVLKETGITATAGIGTNLYLAKVAMDIVAKRMPADKDGVRIAELNEKTYREQLWAHTPLSDFWRVGRGISKRMAKLGCRTMGDIARLSLENEDLLYDTLGINAELLIDHAWGWEPTRIAMIKSYRPENTSISSGQVLMEPYEAEKARLIVQEMAEVMALDLVRKGFVTKKLELTIGYDRTSLAPSKTGYLAAKTGKPYAGEVTTDYYGRPAPKHAHGTANIDRYTSSSRRITEALLALYDRITDRELLVRRVTLAALMLIPENEIPPEKPVQMDLFTDYKAVLAKKDRENEADDREKRLQKATLELQERYGKNAVLKGMNLLDGGTTIDRNSQIGGHKA